MIHSSPAAFRAASFAAGVLDEDDAEGILDDYVTHDDVERWAAGGGCGVRVQLSPATFSSWQSLL